MIRIFLLSVLFCQFIVHCNAQNVPLVHTSDAYWEYTYSGYAVEIKSRNFPIGDTIIDSKQYTIFKNENYRLEYPAKKAPPPNSELSINYTFVRVSEGKLYRKESNNNDSLIFDTSWDIGDSIELNDQIIYRLESIDTVLLGGMDRRKWTFKYIGDETVSQDEYDGIFIEGIGGLFCRLDYIPICGPIGPTTWNEYDAYSLDCFTLNGNQILGNNCELGTNTFKNHVEPKIHINVDDTNDILKIQSDIFYNSTLKIQLIDLNGKIILYTIMSGTNVSVNYPQYLKGIYLVKIRNAEISYHQKILIR